MNTSPTPAADADTPAATSTCSSSAPASPGIYQLYRARQAGFSALLLEAGDGVGGTWYWNRYPGARFDSESYTYGYLFSEELFDEWEWHGALRRAAGDRALPQPRGGPLRPAPPHPLRRQGHRGRLRRRSGTWRVTAGDGTEVQARFLVAATGVLSVPYTPDVPGRDDFRGESYHTGLWPATPVDFAGKRVAVIGTSSQRRAGRPRHRRRGGLADRVPADGQLVHAPEQRADHRRASRRSCGPASSSCATSSTPRCTASTTRPTTGRPSRTPRTSAGASTRQMWNSPGFTKLTSNYTDLLSNPDANAEWCDVHRRQDPRHRARPGDGGAAHPQGPPLRGEAAALRHRLLRGLQPAQRRRWSTCGRRRSCG